MVTIASGGIFVAACSEEVSGNFCGSVSGDVVHLNLHADGLVFQVFDLLSCLFVHGIFLRISGLFALGQNSLSSEDKRLGAYFARETELQNVSAFAEKVLMYLWNDAFKYDHSAVFESEYTTLEQLIDGFKTHRFGVFLASIGFGDTSDSETASDDDNQLDQGDT